MLAARSDPAIVAATQGAEEDVCHTNDDLARIVANVMSVEAITEGEDIYVGSYHHRH